MDTTVMMFMERSGTIEGPHDREYIQYEIPDREWLTDRWFFLHDGWMWDTEGEKIDEIDDDEHLIQIIVDENLRSFEKILERPGDEYEEALESHRRQSQIGSLGSIPSNYSGDHVCLQFREDRGIEAPHIEDLQIGESITVRDPPSIPHIKIDVRSMQFHLREYDLHLMPGTRDGIRWFVWLFDRDHRMILHQFDGEQLHRIHRHGEVLFTTTLNEDEEDRRISLDPKRAKDLRSSFHRKFC